MVKTDLESAVNTKNENAHLIGSQRSRKSVIRAHKRLKRFGKRPNRRPVKGWLRSKDARKCIPLKARKPVVLIAPTSIGLETLNQSKLVAEASEYLRSLSEPRIFYDQRSCSMVRMTHRNGCGSYNE